MEKCILWGSDRQDSVNSQRSEKWKTPAICFIKKKNKKKNSVQVAECPPKVVENIGSYSDANIHNITQAQEAQSTEREMSVVFFSSAIVSMSADKLYLEEVRGNNCQYGTQPAGSGKRTVL